MKSSEHKKSEIYLTTLWRQPAAYGEKNLYDTNRRVLNQTSFELRVKLWEELVSGWWWNYSQCRHSHIHCEP